MILNPNKTKAGVASRSRTLKPLHVDLVLSGVFICASPNLAVLGVKFDSRQPSKTMCAVLSLVSLRELVFWGWRSVSWWTLLCCFIATMHLFSQSLSIVLMCGGLLLNLIFNYLMYCRCIRWPCFALIRLFCPAVISTNSSWSQIVESLRLLRSDIEHPNEKLITRMLPSTPYDVLLRRYRS